MCLVHDLPLCVCVCLLFLSQESLREPRCFDVSLSLCAWLVTYPSVSVSPSVSVIGIIEGIEGAKVC